MNSDLFKKLVRLANNNPNDNEANLAARRACKMIAENDFAALNGSQPQAQGTITWNDVKRSTESAWKPNPPQSPTGRKPTGNPFVDFSMGFDYNSDWYEKFWNNVHKYQTVDYRDKDKTIFDQDEKFYENPKTGAKQKKAEPRHDKSVRKCAECGNEVLTRRITAVFICNKCEWGRYDEGKK